MSTATLENGLRIIFEPSDSEVVYCGYLVCAGTRHEDEADHGMAHFIEHVSFKGTHRRRASQVNRYLERVGGDLNAFTNKQETVYCATVLRKDALKAVDLLTDMVFHSIYPQNEINKEVEVIVDEIDSYRDSPSELIFDEFEQMLFEGSSLGRDILGAPDRLRQYTTADARRFVDAHYRPDNCVFYLYGRCDFGKIVRALEKAHRSPRRMKTEEKTESNDFIEKTHPFAHPVKPFFCVVEKGTHQAHVIMGAPTFGSGDRRRFALLLLNNILGGPGMTSRLNMAVREKHGLVYSIDAYLNSYPDTGYWTIYFGCDADDVERCRKLVMREMERLIGKPLGTAGLKAAKAQICGQIGISCDNREGHSVALAKTYAHFGKHRDVAAVMKGIEAVTAEELQALAAEVYARENISVLIYK